MEGYMSHLKPGNFPKKRPLKLVEPSLPKRSMQGKRKRIEDITRWREDMNFIFEWQNNIL